MGNYPIHYNSTMRVILLLLVVAAFASAEKSLYEASAPSMEGTEENLLSVVKELRQATAGTRHEPAALRIEDHANLIQKAKAYKHSFGARNALRAAIRALVSELNSGHNHDRNALNNERNAGHNAIRNASNRGKGVTRRYRERACPTKKAQVEAEAARNSAKNALNSIKRRKVAKYNAAVRAYNKAAREHAAAMSAFKATTKAEASNAHAACRNAHKAYELLKRDVASNVATRKQVYIASKVITCYIDNLSNNGGAKNCADRARRANTSRWNINAAKMSGCQSKVSLQATLGPLSWRPSKRNCHANHWNERGIKERSTKERKTKERNSKERNNKERNNKERNNKERNNKERSNKERSTKERKKKNSVCPGMRLAGNKLHYKGNQYSIRAGVNPRSKVAGCDSSWYSPDAGWDFAPDNADTRYVAKCLYWATHALVMANGKSYGTKNWRSKKGQLIDNYNRLRINHYLARTSSCNYRILWQKVHYRYQYGAYWRTLNNAKFGSHPLKCENQWTQLPYSFRGADDNSQSHSVCKVHAWQTHVCVFNNGGAWRSKGWGGNVRYSGHHWLGRSGNKRKVNGCNLSVLLRCSQPRRL